jgi:hypothetical protein
VSALRGAAVGALGLTAMHAIVATPQGPGRVGGLLENAGGLVRRFISPAVPAIPDRRELDSAGVGRAAGQGAGEAALPASQFPDPRLPPVPGTGNPAPVVAPPPTTQPPTRRGGV